MTDIKFECPSCRQSLEAPLDMAWQLIDCPACGKTIEIPFVRSSAKPKEHACCGIMTKEFWTRERRRTQTGIEQWFGNALSSESGRNALSISTVVILSSLLCCYVYSCSSSSSSNHSEAMISAGNGHGVAPSTLVEYAREYGISQEEALRRVKTANELREATKEIQANPEKYGIRP